MDCQILFELIKTRRSVRIFNGKKIPREDLLPLIEAGIWAPTGCNNQELRFFIIDQDQALADFLKFKPFFKAPAAAILVFCDMSLQMSKRMYSKIKAEKNLPYIDTGLALGNMINYAKSKGIDSCVINLSPYHLGLKKKINLFSKVLRKIKLRLNLQNMVEESFEFYLRKYLNIPKHLKIMAGVVLGYAEKYPDIAKEMHGGRKVARESIEHYLIND